MARVRKKEEIKCAIRDTGKRVYLFVYRIRGKKGGTFPHGKTDNAKRQ